MKRYDSGLPPEAAGRRCKHCLGPLPPRRKYGFCAATAECRRLAGVASDRAYYGRLQERRGPRACRTCGLPLNRGNRSGRCQRTRACKKVEAPRNREPSVNTETALGRCK